MAMAPSRAETVIGDPPSQTIRDAGPRAVRETAQEVEEAEVRNCGRQPKRSRGRSSEAACMTDSATSGETRPAARMLSKSKPLSAIT